MISATNINQTINEWKETNRFYITWLPNEHQSKETSAKPLEQSSSEIEIKAIDDGSNANQDRYAHESNLSWSFTIANTKEDVSVKRSNLSAIVSRRRKGQMPSTRFIF